MTFGILNDNCLGKVDPDVDAVVQNHQALAQTHQLFHEMLDNYNGDAEFGVNFFDESRPINEFHEVSALQGARR
jgi:hypothetical protein